jgi:hypothetical protein
MSKIRKEDYENILALSEDHSSLSDAFKLFINVTRNTALYTFICPLKIEYDEYKEDKVAGKNVNGKLADISQRFAKILQKCAVENNFTDNTLENNKDFQGTEYQPKNTDDVFKHLADIDFKFQDGKFAGLIEHRNFSTFIIRGNGNCGQNWLIHQLIVKYFPCVNPKIIDAISSQSITLEDIINEFKKLPVKYEFSETDTQKYKLQDMAEKLAKITDNHLILIINSGNFLFSDEFGVFYENFIEHLTMRARSMKKKIVLFLKYTKPLKTSQEELSKKIPKIEYWCYDNDNHSNNESIFSNKWCQKTEAPHIVALHSIQPLSVKMLLDWKKAKFEQKIMELECLSNEDSAEKFLNNQCEGGNPLRVIEYLTNKLGYTDTKWLEY